MSKEQRRQNLSGISRLRIIRPHLTEKSSILAELGQYTFFVANDAEKVSLTQEFVARYGISPVRVRVIRLPSKTIRHGRNIGSRGVRRKAIFTLRSGDKIPFGVKT
ncbi:MAG: 50S ribosomal protein L23 [Candidatus Uhrbacteria bacterium]